MVTEESKKTMSWSDALLMYAHPSSIRMIFLGFSAGLPYLLVFSTLTAWLTEAGLSRTAIGFFAWIGITYSVKVFWAPVVDNLHLPVLHKLLGKRRSWMFFAQLIIATTLFFMAKIGPANNLLLFSLAAVVVAFFSATQDVAIDAYRIETMDPEYQGVMAATYIFGYRLAMLVAGAGALYISEFWNWSAAYSAMALLMSVGIMTTLLVSEPVQKKNPLAANRKRSTKEWMLDAVVMPFVDFIRRNGKQAVVILALVASYRVSDITMGIMANPFYLDLGFSKKEIADIGKIFGFFMTMVGAALGGILVIRLGFLRSLLLGAVLVAVTNLLFAYLAGVGNDITWLAIVISADNISGGIGISVLIAYMASLTSQKYTATQYALFSSIMTLPAKFVSGFSGVVVDAQGYVAFFVYASLLGIPAIIIVLYMMSQRESYFQKHDD